MIMRPFQAATVSKAGKESSGEKNRRATVPGWGSRLAGSGKQMMLATGGGAVILHLERGPGSGAPQNEEYRRFEQEWCLPMLRKQPGLLGVFFLRPAEDRAASTHYLGGRGSGGCVAKLAFLREITHELAQSALLGGTSRWRSWRSGVDISDRRRW